MILGLNNAINQATFPIGSSLEILSVSRNDLTELPELLIYRTPNISEINLSRNRISHIVQNTFRCSASKLKIINLSHNNIETIDELLFVDLRNLEILYLGHNFIEHFQVHLFVLTNLMGIHLDNNKIARMDCTNFALSTSKIYVDVSWNFIQEIDLNCTRHIESLEINIAGNDEVC